MAFSFKDIRGILPALTTPFVDGIVSPGHLEANIARSLSAGAAGVLVLGSTGESVYVDDDERHDLIRAARRATPPGRLLAGTHAESTRAAVRAVRNAADAGADAALVITPHYFGERMTDDALIAHFENVADSADVPIVLYNVPKFTHVRLSIAAVVRLSRHERIAGIKDSMADPDRIRAIRDGTEDGFVVFAGEQAIVAPALMHGASGAILAAAAAVPEPYVELARACAEGDADRAADLQRDAAPRAGELLRRWGIPGLKAAIDWRGGYGGAPRLPLEPLDEASRLELETLCAGWVETGWLPARFFADR